MLKSEKIYFILIALFCAAFFLLNVFTPYFSDDWHFGFMIGEERNIGSFWDVLVSNYRHYFESNGRLVPHLFVMTFAGLLGKGAFNVFNAFLFGAFLHLLTLNFAPQKEDQIKVLSVSVFLIVLFMCGFKYTLLWMSGVCNYELIAVLLLLFHYLLKKESYPHFAHPLLFLYGIVVGWSNEAFVVGLCLGYLVYFVPQIRKMKKHQWLMLSGLAVGVALCIFSPGSIHRALGSSGESSFSVMTFVAHYASSLFYMNNVRLFFIMLLMVMILKKKNLLWMVAAISSFIFVSLTGFDNENSRFGIELYSLAVILSIFPYLKLSLKFYYMISFIALLYLGMSITYCEKNYDEFKNVENQIVDTRNAVIKTNEVKVPWFAQRFVLTFIFPEGHAFYNGFMYDGWENENISRYYSAHRNISFLPQVFVESAQKGEISAECRTSDGYPFYACLYPESEIKSVKFKLTPSKYVSFPLIGRMQKYSLNEIEASKLSEVNVDGRRYLLIGKNTVLQDRVETIVVE